MNQYFRHGHFRHAGTVCLTSLLSGPWLPVSEKVKRYRNHRRRSPPLFHAYPSPWINEANRILLRVSSDLPYSPATFRGPPSKHSRSPFLAFSAQVEVVHLIQAISRNSHTRLLALQLPFQVRHVRRTRLRTAPAFRRRRCSARCCPWVKPMKLLLEAVEGQHHRQSPLRIPLTPRTHLSLRRRAHKAHLPHGGSLVSLGPQSSSRALGRHLGRHLCLHPWYRSHLLRRSASVLL